MIQNNFIFADLSTYSPKETISFYESVFNWNFEKNSDYYMSFLNGNEITGLYETPEKFKQMRMPHFWMSYIQVQDVEEIVEKAKSNDGIIELVDLNNSLGKVALIRDPLGAGFTVCSGDNITSTRTKNEIGTLIWNELHVSDASKVIPFYEKILNWKINKVSAKSYTVSDQNDVHFADIHEIPKEVKGKYEYWICVFAVDNLEESSQTIINQGGKIIADEGERILFVDNSDEAFFYIKQAI